LWDAFIGDEMRLDQVSTNYKDEDVVLDLTLIEKVRRGGRKGPGGVKKARGRIEIFMSGEKRLESYQVLQV
jgi:hypothetical protein